MTRDQHVLLEAGRHRGGQVGAGDPPAAGPTRRLPLAGLSTDARRGRVRHASSILELDKNTQ